MSTNNQKECFILGMVISGLKYIVALLEDHKKALGGTANETGQS